MPSYKAPVEDTLFILNDVLGIERYNGSGAAAQAYRRSVLAREDKWHKRLHGN